LPELILPARSLAPVITGAPLWVLIVVISGESPLRRICLPAILGLTPDGGHLTGGTTGLAGRMSACRASVVSTPRSFGSRLPAW